MATTTTQLAMATSGGSFGLAGGGIRPAKAPAGLRAVDSDAQMESSFRRLLAAIEAEREDIRGSWSQLQDDRESTIAELEELRAQTEDWCAAEKAKIDAEWRRLDRLSEKMADIWPKKFDLVKINCSGTIYEVPRATLCGIDGSYLALLFSEENVQQIQPDADGCYYLDINPHCFSLIIEYLLNRRLRIDAPLPVIPKIQQLNMELLAEAWNLKPFLKENTINTLHGTSLHVNHNTVQATHPGWQVISALYPMPLANPYYFEVKVMKNPASGSSGGLALGVMGHVPQGPEIHTIRLPNAVMYNSNNGILSEVVDQAERDKVTKGVVLTDGTTMGVRHDPASRSLEFFYNGDSIGSVKIKDDALDRMRELFPVFALYVPGQVIQVEFRTSMKASLSDGMARG